MLLMIEKGIRRWLCHEIHRYAKANNKYMKNCDKNIISSYLMSLDANNLHGWAMSQTLHVNGFKWVKELPKFTENFIEGYDENSDRGYFFEVGVEYPKNLLNLYKDLSFLPERNKKFVCNIHDKENYVVHTKALKQTLNHVLILKRVYKVIQFNQETWLKPYIDMGTELRKEAKKWFWKRFL